MNLPPELEVGVNMNQWLSELTQNKVNVTRPSFQTVKVQFYALGLIRIEMLMRRVFFASNPAPPTSAVLGADRSRPRRPC